MIFLPEKIHPLSQQRTTLSLFDHQKIPSSSTPPKSLMYPAKVSIPFSRAWSKIFKGSSARDGMADAMGKGKQKINFPPRLVALSLRGDTNPAPPPALSFDTALSLSRKINVCTHTPTHKHNLNLHTWWWVGFLRLAPLAVHSPVTREKISKANRIPNYDATWKLFFFLQSRENHVQTTPILGEVKLNFTIRLFTTEDLSRRKKSTC